MRRLIVLLVLGSLTLMGSGAAYAKTALAANMDGRQEVPDGDRDGRGGASVIVYPGKNLVCYKLWVRNIKPAAAAHIHFGARGVNGPIVLDLNPPTRGSSQGCATVSERLEDGLEHRPHQYYVNVHNAPFPAGAVRGQLFD